MSLFCKHRWVTVGADKMQGYLQLDRNRFTKVLETCRDCGTHRTRTISGWWYIDELTKLQS